MSPATATTLTLTSDNEQQVAKPTDDSVDDVTSVLPLLLATDACCQGGHVTAEVERGGGEPPVLVCVTCAEWWGYREGLRGWAERCPDDFSQIYPRGLEELDRVITARPTV